MARTGFFHHIGSFALFAATVLLVITCISAPVVHDLALLKVELGDTPNTEHATVNFGTFGFCINNVNNQGDQCSKSTLGYSPSDVMNTVDNTQFSDDAASSTTHLTKAMILHPIACGINFIAFLLALGAGVVGSFLASLVALVAFLVTCVIMIIDFVLFSIVKSNVNNDGTGASASFGAAAWTILVAAICSLVGTIILFFSCCSARLHRNRTHASKADMGYTSPPRRRRWF